MDNRFNILLIFLIGFMFGILIFTATTNQGLSPTGLAVSLPDEVQRTVPVVAINNRGEGEIGSINLKIVDGESNILVETNPFLRTDLQYSTNTGVEVAKKTAGRNTFNKDFIFSFDVNTQMIGGESAGAAITIATIAALENKKIKDDVVITGTIRENGRIGQVGGVLEKAKAVADAGYDNFLVPQGQSEIRYYKRVKEQLPGCYNIRDERLKPETIDLKVALREWGLTVVEVSDIEEAAEYMLE